LFVFCPNVQVCKSIINKLQSIKNNLLIYGPSGCSKTVSMVLICYLNSLINIFRYEANQQPNSNEVNQKKTEYELLKGSFELDVPKYWYWNINDSSIKEKTFDLKKVILDQAPEIPLKTKKKLSKIK
jgi:hypothetical protein